MRGRADYEGVDVPKVTAAVAALVLVLALAGCGDDGGNAAPASERSAAQSESATEASEPPLTAEPQTDADAREDTDTFLTFVRARMGTYKSQIPNATDEQLIQAGRDACTRLRDGESYEMMSVIEGEKVSEPGGYYYDSNAIIAGAQMHLCPETIEVPESGDAE